MNSNIPHPIRSPIPTSREERMQKESMKLWHPVSELCQTKQYDKAIAFCRRRLADPLSHVPEPRSGTPDELRVMGHFLLGQLLLVVHVDPFAPNPDPTKEDEALEQIKLAKRGFELYYPDALTIQADAVGCLAEILDRRASLVSAAEEYRCLIMLYKRILQREGVNRDKGTADFDLVDAFRKLARCSSKLGQSLVALRTIQEAMEVLRKYNVHRSKDPQVTAILLETILEQANYLLDNGGNPDDALRDISAAAEMLDKALDSNPENKTVLANYGSSLSVLGRKFMQTGVVQMAEHGANLFETATSTFYNAIQIPEDREKALPDKFNTAYCLPYAQSIVHFARAIDGSDDEHEIAVLDNGLELVLMSAYSDVPIALREQRVVPTSDAHRYYLTEFDWPKLDIPRTLVALTILNMETTKRINVLKQTSGSSRRGFSREESEVVRAEIRRVLQLADTVWENTTSEELRREASVHKACALSNRGRLEVRSSRLTAKATWAKALELVETSPKCEGLEMELEREFLVKKLNDYLAMVR